MEQILNFCSVARKAKDIAEQLGINQNTLRSHYLYPMVKNGKLIRVKGVTLYKKVD
jgi:predicted ArsR family transcriptional regulator